MLLHDLRENVILTNFGAKILAGRYGAKICGRVGGDKRGPPLGWTYLLFGEEFVPRMGIITHIPLLVSMFHRDALPPYSSTSTLITHTHSWHKFLGLQISEVAMSIFILIYFILKNDCNSKFI